MHRSHSHSHHRNRTQLNSHLSWNLLSPAQCAHAWYLYLYPADKRTFVLLSLTVHIFLFYPLSVRPRLSRLDPIVPSPIISFNYGLLGARSLVFFNSSSQTTTLFFFSSSSRLSSSVVD